LLEPSRALARRVAALKRHLVGVHRSQPASTYEPLVSPYNAPHRLYDEASDVRVKDMPPLSRMLFSWFHGSVLPTILRSYDRASMAHGIEVRMPFMDWRLVTFSFALPEASKIGGGYTKRVLRLAMNGVMPDAIRLRTDKIGFTSPLDEWTRGRLRPWVDDIVESRSFLESTAWNGDAVRGHVRRALAGETSINPAWPVLNAHVLQESFKAAARTESSPMPVTV
jgi:asparagine synthetase B (glutamine-hydrolysing)